MAHQLEHDRAMVYCGERPWHGLGVHLGDVANATLDTVLEALPASGSSISHVPALAPINGALVEVADAWVAIRDYDSKPLGVVGNQARQAGMSPMRALASFARLFGEGRACVHTAGFLRGGKVFWIAGKAGEPIAIQGANGQSDSVEKYFLLVTSFDNSMVTNLLLSPVRPVCNNTVTAAVNCANAKTKIKHTQSHETALSLAETQWEAILSEYDNFARKVQIYATTPVTDLETQAILRQAFGVDNATEVKTRTQNNIDLAHDLVASGQGNAPWRGTLWGVFNGLTEYADHCSIVRNARNGQGVQDKSEAGTDRILDSVLFGASAAFKANAMALCDKFAGLTQ